MKLSLQDVLSEGGWTANSKLDKSVEYLKVDFENGNSAETLRGMHTIHTGEGQDAIVFDERGYEFVVEKLSEKFRDKIKMKKEVKLVNKIDGKYIVHTADGSIYHTKYVLVSVFKTVLENRMIQFTTDLPSSKYDS